MRESAPSVKTTPEVMRALLEVKVSKGSTFNQLKEVLEDPRGVLVFVLTPGDDMFVGLKFHKGIYDQNGIDEDGKSLEGRIMKRGGKIEVNMYGSPAGFRAVFGADPYQREVIASYERIVAEKIREFFGV